MGRVGCSPENENETWTGKPQNRTGCFFDFDFDDRTGDRTGEGERARDDVIRPSVKALQKAP